MSPNWTAPRAPAAARRDAAGVFGRLRRGAAAPLLQYAASRVSARHPGLLERLAPLAGRCVLVDVDELPDSLAIAVDAAGLRVTLVDGSSPPPAAARVGGDLSALIDLAEGRADGDALFFQRRIRIEGETEAVLLLRNALEGAEVDLVGDVFPPLRPLASPLRALAEIGAAGLAMVAGKRSAAPRVTAGR